MHYVKQILKENWKTYLKMHNPTAHQKREIQKMIDCSKNSCNSRICSSCGKRYADDWANSLKRHLHPIPNKHIVLTVPSFLRPTLRNWGFLRMILEIKDPKLEIITFINTETMPNLKRLNENETS